MRLNLRNKLLLFTALIAALPLVIAGQSLIRIAQDELKSSANDQLVTTARQVRDEINSVYQNAWLAPLKLIRNAIDDDKLGVDEKISMLTLGIADLPDIVALQLTLKGSRFPLMVTKDDFNRRLSGKVGDPVGTLRVSSQVIEAVTAGKRNPKDLIQHIPETGDWLTTIILPLRNKLAGQDATMSARVDLARIRQMVAEHPFGKTGSITVVGSEGRQIFDQARADLSGNEVVSRARGLLASRSRVINVAPHKRPDGAEMLGAVSFPNDMNWAIIAEKSLEDAYYAVGVMIKSLTLWLTIGLGAAMAGAVYFALRMSRPILAIGEAAIEVGKGNFQARVDNIKSRDEIGDLAERINQMIGELNERFQLQKFVSAGTMKAIKGSDKEGVQLGGERRNVAMLFADIRGYTAFAEQRDPVVVVDVLNHYFQRQADIVSANDGDIDKFVGDQIMAVFHGRSKARNAVKCALEIQDVMTELGKEYPEAELHIGIGIDQGEVVMGAMGSRDRMDYTVLGDHVNLAARLCGSADPKQTLVTEAVRKGASGLKTARFAALEPIRVKGKSKPIKIFSAGKG